VEDETSQDKIHFSGLLCFLSVLLRRTSMAAKDLIFTSWTGGFSVNGHARRFDSRASGFLLTFALYLASAGATNTSGSSAVFPE